jgi:histidyl-tRNA synthetase
MFGKLRETVESFGFEEYDGPLLESFDLYAAKSGEELVNQQLYSFTDRGDRRVAIRPEMTPTLARLVAAQLHQLPKPIRWYSIPNLWRYERPQRGRLREHWQLNVDILGGEPVWADAEILVVAHAVMAAFGQNHGFDVHVNNRRLMDHLFRQILGLEDEASRKVSKAIDARPKIGEPAYLELLTQAGLSQAQTRDLESFLGADVTTLRQRCPCQGTDEVLHLLELLAGQGLERTVRFDPRIMRGLDYYTGTVFEIFDKAPTNTRAMFGGGRYDNLIGLFGKDHLPGVGFGMGDVTLQNYLESHRLLPVLPGAIDVFIGILENDYVTRAQAIAHGLRQKGLRAATSLQSGRIGALIKQCEKHGCRWFLLFGEDEIKNQQVSLKDLTTGTQLRFADDDFDGLARHLR